MDKEAGYSITDEVTADQMTMRILDAFQHVGCTTLYIIFLLHSQYLNDSLLLFYYILTFIEKLYHVSFFFFTVCE